MNRRTIAAAATAVGLASASVLMTAAPATAATTIDNTTFYTEADFGVEGPTYPAGVDWFFADVSGVDGSADFTPLGIEFNTGVDGKVQILNQNVATPDSATDLYNLLDNAVSIASSGDDWTFQLPFFAEGDSVFTTLRPQDPNTVDPTGNWISSQNLPATGSTPAYNANTPYPLTDLLDSIYADAFPTLLAYGFHVEAGDQPIIHAINWNNTISAFTPVWQYSVPTTITDVDFSTPGKGLALSFSGSLPGNFAYVDLEDSDGNEVFYDSEFGEVSPTGTYSGALVLPTKPAPGTYYLTFDDDGYAYGFLGMSQYIEITVVPALAATGVDATLPIGIAVTTLIGGALLVFAARRRSEQA